MSNLIATRCPNCGADIEIDTGLKSSICKYCNSKIILEDVLKNLAKNSERIENINKFIEIEEYENALIIVCDMLQENPLDLTALIYQVKIMVYLFDFDNFDEKSANFLDETWKTLKLIISNYDRVCKINKGVPPQEFDDINDKIELLKKWNSIGIEEANICDVISEKLNIIWNMYKGDKNKLLMFLNEKIGLATNQRTVAKFYMMKSSQSYEEEEYNKPFTYAIKDRVLQKFEYKRDNSVEVTYDTEEDDSFAVEYYGRITKYSDLKELIKALDEIILQIKNGGSYGNIIF